jgi:hypothetical protein
MVAPGIESGPLDLKPGTLTTRPKRRSVTPYNLVRVSLHFGRLRISPTSPESKSQISSLWLLHVGFLLGLSFDAGYRSHTLPETSSTFIRLHSVMSQMTEILSHHTVNLQFNLHKQNLQKLLILTEQNTDVICIIRLSNIFNWILQDYI